MDNFIPKRVFTLLEAKPSEKIYEVCIVLKDVQGAVSKTAKVLLDASVNIRTATLFDAVDRDGVGYWTSFIDLSKSVTDIKKVEEELRKLDVVRDVKVKEPKPLIYDVVHFPIFHGGSTAVVMPVELFGSLFDEIEKNTDSFRLRSSIL